MSMASEEFVKRAADIFLEKVSFLQNFLETGVMKYDCSFNMKQEFPDYVSDGSFCH